MLLQVYYLIISIYGWWAWRHGSVKTNDRKNDLKIKRLTIRTSVRISAVTLLIFALMWYVLDNFTDSPVPLWDAIITTLSVVATWMLTRKILEQWHVWIIANAIAIAVYVFKGMYPTVILFIVYFVMAVEGLREWKRDYYGNSFERQTNCDE